MFIPDHLQGTPAGELLQQIETAARERGLFVKRERKAAGYGFNYVYTVLRNDQVDVSLTIEGAEGKTLRAKSSAQLQDLLAHLLSSPALDPEEIPTQPIPGAYLLGDEQRERLRAWGVVWHKDRRCWLASPVRLAEATEYLKPRLALELGKLSREHEYLLKRTVPEAARRVGSDYRWTVLRTHHAAFAEAIRQAETLIGLGSRFPRSANDELRDLGARWSATQWTIRADREAQAREIIARHQAAEAEAVQAAEARRQQRQEEERSAGILRWSQGEGYGGEYLTPGALIYHAPERGAERAWYVVTECGKRYVREDGMSFGVGDEQGYIYSYVARPAQPEEYAEREGARLAEIERLTAVREYDRLFGQVFAAGERTAELLALEGERIEHPTDGQNLYGGGRWMVLEAGRIWAVRNNGMDGDNWAHNNVRTGGAGAIGRWVPADPELAERIRSAAARGSRGPATFQAQQDLIGAAGD